MQTYENHTIKESQCDCFRRLKLNHIFLMMQDAAFKDLHEYGYGGNALLGKDLAFLIRRAIVNVVALPQADDLVIVGTSQVSQQAMTYTRDFVFHCNNKICITATTQWFLCRISDKTIVRPVIETKSHSEDAVNLNIGNKPVINIEDAEEYNIIKAGYSIIDGNMHVNNSEYVSWACDAPCAYSFLEKGHFLFDIYFRKEVVHNSILSLKQEGNSICGTTQDEVNFIASFS